jgi:hypothetical protein
MLANAEEQKALMQDIIAISANSSEWNSTLKNYWNSFNFDIPESGKELEVGFVYDINSLDKQKYIEQINNGIKDDKKKLKTDEDLLNYIEKRVEAINTTFTNNIKAAQNIKDPGARQKAIDNAYRVKYDSLVKVEGERYKVGSPIIPFDYILYRYCLVYGDIANELALINKSPKIRFYLQSQTDIKRMKKAEQSVNRTRNKLLLEVTENVEKMHNLLYAMGKGGQIPNDDVELYDMIEKLSHQDTDNFIRIASDKDLNIIGAIEKYIASGIFTRYEGSTTIYDSTDLEKPLGNTTEEVVAFFKNQANKATVKEFETRYKNLGVEV